MVNNWITVSSSREHVVSMVVVVVIVSDLLVAIGEKANS